DVPVQVITPAQPAAFRVVDLSELDTDRANAEARTMLRDTAEQPFDLETGPVMRVVVVRFAPDDHLLLSVIHHVAIDGWSRAPFWKQLSELYAQAVAGEPVGLAPQRLQYADFALWQRDLLSGGVQEEQLAYWSEQL